MATLTNDQYQLNAQSAQPVGGTNIGGTTWMGQVFTPSVSGNLVSVTIPLHKSGTPATFELAVRAEDGAGKPTGPDLAVATIIAADVPTTTNDIQKVTLTFGSPPALVGGTKYCLIGRQLGDANGPTTQFYRWYASGTTSNYSGGTGFWTNNSGSSWNTITNDFCFVTKMDVAVATPGLDQYMFGNNPNGSAERITANTERKAQTFIPTVSVQLKKVRLQMHRLDSQTGGSITVEIQGVDGANKPNGTALASQSVADTAIPNSSANNALDVTFTTPASLTAGTQYAIVLIFPNANGTTRYSIAHTSSSTTGAGGYGDGQNWVSTDSGGSWVSDAGARDLAFGTFMLEPTTTTQTVNADTTVQTTAEQTINSDAFHGAITTQNVNSDAQVVLVTSQTILSDAFHGQETSKTINSDASIGVTQTQTITSDAFHGAITSQVINSNANVQITSTQTILANTNIFLEIEQVINANTTILAYISQTINAAATIALIQSQTIASDAIIIVREPVLKFYVVI